MPSRSAEREEVDIRHHTVIYNVTGRDEEGDDRPARADAERKCGWARPKCANIFKVPKAGTIAGCYVIDGRITRSGDTKARLMRDGALVHEGKIGSLRRFKDDVSEVKSGFECGIAFDKYNDVKVGDLIEVFTIERVAVSA
jgi:translation initiation factor IF-2